MSLKIGGLLAKVEAFFKAVGKVAATVAKQIWSGVSDHQWDFDPWKAGGIAAFVLAAIWSSQVFDLALAKGVRDPGTLGVLAGLVTAFITVGTFLFGQAKSHDNALIGKGPEA
jgi:hypothetical protein